VRRTCSGKAPKVCPTKCRLLRLVEKPLYGGLVSGAGGFSNFLYTLLCRTWGRGWNGRTRCLCCLLGPGLQIRPLVLAVVRRTRSEKYPRFVRPNVASFISSKNLCLGGLVSSDRGFSNLLYTLLCPHGGVDEMAGPDAFVACLDLTYR
jgi:hypothetical protein